MSEKFTLSAADIEAIEKMVETSLCLPGLKAAEQLRMHKTVLSNGILALRKAGVAIPYKIARGEGGLSIDELAEFRAWKASRANGAEHHPV